MYDQNVVRRVMDGDLDAFSKMYNDCAPAVYRRAYSLTEDPVTSREIVRNTFRDIRKYAKELSQPSDFDEWVFRLVNLYVERSKTGSNQLWSEPNLADVWEELNSETQKSEPSQASQPKPTPAPAAEKREKSPAPTPTQKEKKKKEEAEPIEDAEGAKWVEKIKPKDPDAQELPSETTEDMWEPILFPPEEGAGNGAALDAMENAAPVVSGLEEDVPEETAGGATPDEEQNTIPLLEENQAESGETKGKKVRKVRYEAARVKPDVRFSVERVPYDYVPYEEGGQEAYERITLEDSPRAVYEHVPYHRPEKDDALGEFSVKKVPFEANPVQKAPQVKGSVVPPLPTEVYEANIPTANVALSPGESGRPGELTAKEAQSGATGADDHWSLSEEVAKEATPANDGATEKPIDPVDQSTEEKDWNEIDPLRLDIDEILQQIVDEVDGTSTSASEPVEVVSEEVIVEVAPDEPTPLAQTQETPTSISEKASEAEKEDSVTQSGNDTNDSDHQDAPSETKIKQVGDTDDLPAHVLPENNIDPIVERPRKNKKMLVGAGFFVGAIILLVIVILIGYRMGLW